MMKSGLTCCVFTPMDGVTLPRRMWRQLMRKFNEQISFSLAIHIYDHILDVPHIALKTRAAVIGTESTENVMRAYAVPEGQLITVRGGGLPVWFLFPQSHSQHSQPSRPQALLQFRHSTGWNESTVDLGTDPPRGGHSCLLHSFPRSSDSRVWWDELHRTRDCRTGAGRRVDRSVKEDEANPVAGHFVRTADGKLTGVVYESAKFQINRHRSDIATERGSVAANAGGFLRMR
jgi:hypothetical protein